METKFCPACETKKSVEDFYVDNARLDKRAGVCKKCRSLIVKRWKADNKQRLRNDHLKKYYGITLEEFDEIFEKQGKCCAICKTNNPGKREWHVDHNHTTNIVRGILCYKCNFLLGLADDNPTVLVEAAEYLTKERLPETSAQNVAA